MCEDYNIDLLKIQTNCEFSLFYENIIATGFAPKITLPTRLCDTMHEYAYWQCLFKCNR